MQNLASPSASQEQQAEQDNGRQLFRRLRKQLRVSLSASYCNLKFLLCLLDMIATATLLATHTFSA